MAWISEHSVEHPLLLPPNTIPPRFRKRSVSEIQNTAIVRAITSYFKHFEKNAAAGLAPAFLGKAGTYKSFGAGIVADRVYRQARVPLLYVECTSRLPELERERYEASTNVFMRHARTVPFLVMDDFTQVRPGTWTADMLLEIADARYNAHLPTLWTGNLVVSATDWAPLVKGYGASFARRLMEGAKGFTVVIK